MWDCLPADVWTEEILCRLPVKSIIECRCVCKSWCSLITTPNFISAHFLANPKETTTQTIFVHQRYVKSIRQKHNLNVIKRCVLLFDNNSNEEECLFRAMSIRLPGLAWRKEVVGSVNGLICLSEGLDGVQGVPYFILFNPSIGRFLSIPSPELDPSSETWCCPVHLSTVKGLGFDETTHDYKILYIYLSHCFVYSLNSNSWRKLLPPPPFLSSPWSADYPPSVVFLNGRIHWIHSFKKQCTRWPVRFIMVFHLKDETFSRISLPECFSDPPPDRHSNRFSIHEFGESSFALVHKSDFQADVWVMKELYGSDESSWIKFATFHSQAFPHSDGFLQIMGFRNKDQVLTHHKQISGIVSHSIHNDEEEAKNLFYGQDNTETLRFGRVYKYVPSLVLLDKQNNLLDDAHVVVVDGDFEVAQSHQVEPEQETS